MAEFTQDDITIAYEVAGEGPPVLLLHGFPQTRAMWNDVVPALAARFTVVTADLRGYGASSKPPADPDLANYAFRAMAADQLALMRHLGHDRFHLVGHDRGARTAYRLALDAPEAVQSLALMDIVPTDHILRTWGYPVSKAYFHWSFMAQPAPFPEHMIEADPDHFYQACLLGWGSATLDQFAAIDTYRAAWRDPATIAGMTNDYRAAVTIDQDHDRADRGRRLNCPALVLYGASGAMAGSYDLEAVWSERFTDLTVRAIPGGHFFIDQNPAATVAALLAFLPGGQAAARQ